MLDPTSLTPITLAAWFFLACPASAHDLHLKAEKRQGRLHVEAWYDDDVPADGARVKVLQQSKLVAEGSTNDRGVWTTDCPPAGAYSIIATDTGHRAEIPFVIEESLDIQRAGTSKEEVSQRHWLGAISGAMVLLVLVIVGRWMLRRPTSRQSA